MKLIESGSLWGGQPTISVIHEIIGVIISFVLFFPTLLMWMFTYNLTKFYGIILGLILNFYYWYYLSCAIYSFKEKRKKTLVP